MLEEYIQEDHVHEYIHRRIALVRFDELTFGKLTQKPCSGHG